MREREREKANDIEGVEVSEHECEGGGVEFGASRSEAAGALQMEEELPTVHVLCR